VILDTASDRRRPASGGDARLPIGPLAARGEVGKNARRQMTAPVTRIPALVTFPRDDQAFASFVQATMDRLDPAARADPAALQRAIRRWHTRAIVRAQNPLASFGTPAWYVYRDGQAGVRTDDAWWQAPGVATAWLGEDAERFVWADAAAAALVERTPDDFVGLAWRDLVPSAVRDDDAAWLFADLKARPVQSVFDYPLADGGRRVIEYRTAWSPEDGCFVCRWRELAVIDPQAVPRLIEE
jgi:PAS domain-containing protein